MKVLITASNREGHPIEITSDELFALLKGSDSRINWKVTDISVHEDGFFQLPHMRLHRDDLLDKGIDTDKINDEMMQELADKLSDALICHWHDCLDELASML